MDIRTLALSPFAAPAGAAHAPRTLREAAHEFESLFIAQAMQVMRRTVPESGLLGAGSGQHLFREMLDQELARQMAHSGRFGIGELLCRQLAGEASEQFSGVRRQASAGTDPVKGPASNGPELTPDA